MERPSSDSSRSIRVSPPMNSGIGCLEIRIASVRPLSAVPRKSGNSRRSQSLNFNERSYGRTNAIVFNLKTLWFAKISAETQDGRFLVEYA
jgi:hypothetical protein